MITMHMTPRKFRERLEESDDRIDPRKVAEALKYVRDDGRRN